MFVNDVQEAWIIFVFCFHILVTTFLPLKPDFYLWLFILHKRWINVQMDLQSLHLYFLASLEPLFMILCISNNFQSGSDLKEYRLVQFLKTVRRRCLKYSLGCRSENRQRSSRYWGQWDTWLALSSWVLCWLAEPDNRTRCICY